MIPLALMCSGNVMEPATPSLPLIILFILRLSKDNPASKVNIMFWKTPSINETSDLTLMSSTCQVLVLLSSNACTLRFQISRLFSMSKMFVLVIGFSGFHWNELPVS